MYPFSQPVVSSAEVSSCVTESAKSQSVIPLMVYVCVDSTKRLTTALEVAGIKAIHDQNASDITTSLDNIDDCPEVGEPCEESVVRFWEAEASVLPSQESVQGRLKQSPAFWKDVLQAPPPILECIEKGCRLPLKFIPPSHSQSNHKSAELHHEFVDRAIQNLIQNRCIIRKDQKPYICSLLSVVENSSGKLHLVLNLRYLNQFLHAPNFKYEDLQVAALLFEKHEFHFNQVRLPSC